MSLLHQAAFWGHAEAVRRLLQEFHVDATELTDEGSHLTAAPALYNPTTLCPCPSVIYLAPSQ
eukprot:2607533-Amphidinium_carterae.1